MQEWQEEGKLSEKYSKYRDEFLDLLSEYLTDGHLGRINVEKHRIKLVHDNLRPMRWSQYRAGPKKREFKKTEIVKMIAQKVLEPA